MMQEMLYDGPIDGLMIDAAGPLYIPTDEVLRVYPQALGSLYERRPDGRLYRSGSRWDRRW